MTRRRARGASRAAVAALVSGAALLAAACAEVGTGPGDAVSIGFDSLPPSIVAGDTLRDADGNVLRVRGVAYNGDGGTIADAPFRYIYVPARVDTAGRLDTALVVDSITGFVRAPRFTAADTSVRVDSARIAARLGSVLQIVRSVRIVRRPQTLSRVAGDTGQRIAYVTETGAPGSDLARAQADSNTSTPLRVRVSRDSAGAQAGVPRYLVRYRVVRPAGALDDSAAVVVLGTSGRQGATVVDTTDVNGNTVGARLRVRPSRFTGGAVPATITVEAIALYQKTPLAGSPLGLVVPVARRTTGG